MTQTVIVLGGGVAGLSAAHELCERGFAVRVFELRDVPGGKARSVVVPSTARGRTSAASTRPARRGGRRDLPGEHGFRFFPRFYKHVIDTMERIPYRGPRTVADNLVDTTGTSLRALRPPLRSTSADASRPMDLAELFASAQRPQRRFRPRARHLTRRVRVLRRARSGRSSPAARERRMAEYEKIGWWDFIGAEQRSDCLSEAVRARLHPLARRGPGEAGEHQDDRRHVRAATSSTSPSRASAPTGCSTARPTTSGSIPGSRYLRSRGRRLPARHAGSDRIDDGSGGRSPA